jgi:hypothetical protein
MMDPKITNGCLYVSNIKTFTLDILSKKHKNGGYLYTPDELSILITHVNSFMLDFKKPNDQFLDLIVMSH